MDASQAVEHRNEVVLVGRVSGVPVERELPSGDVIVTFRVVVDRPLASPRAANRRVPDAATVPRPRQATVDTLDCVVWRAEIRRHVLAYVVGDVVEVQGSLRRRFWRSGAGAASRSEVEVARCRRLRRSSASPR